MTIPSASKDAEQMKLSYVAGKNAKQYSHYENSLALSYKIKYTLTIYNSAIPLLVIICWVFTQAKWKPTVVGWIMALKDSSS